MMTINQTLSWGVKILKLKHVDSPALDAEMLLALTLGNRREYLMAHPEKKLNWRQLAKFKSLIHRRAHREPVAYITGKKEFFGLNFYVNENVLIPRPETEILVEAALRELTTTGENRLVLDVGTGSGCIAITIAKELKNKRTKEQKNKRTEAKIRIVAIDSSKEALEIAKKNAKLHGLSRQIKFLRGNLLQAPLAPFSHFHRSMELQLCRSTELEGLVVLANLPYLTEAEWKRTQPEIKKYEPKSALVGGKDGLQHYRGLLKQLASVLRQNRRTAEYKNARTREHKNKRTQEQENKRIEELENQVTKKREGLVYFFEINQQQKNPLQRIIYSYFPKAKVEFIKDLNGAVRVLKFKLS